MPRTLRARLACALALAFIAAGCQDYNFNPVGHCLIQPGTKRVTLSNVSSADVLFVVDESGSMGGEQAKLASNFSSFITNLDQANAARVDGGLQPFDFHLAVTTTSVFWNYQTSNTCSSTCTGAAGQLVCCKPDGTVAKKPRACPTGGECAGLAGTTCGLNCSGYKGESYCCNQTDGSFPLGSVTEVIPCSRAGAMCGSFETHYDFGSCTAGVAVDQWPYPGGDFVSWTSGASANPRVLHFDKEVYTGTTNRQGFTRAQLVDFFRGGGAVGGNVLVGTCGSGEEQALQAAKLAIEKSAAQRQKDTYARVGTGTPLVPQQTWTPATRTAGSGADFLQGSNSKLVLVFVGDEDDCSSPPDPSGGVVMLAEPAGADACVRDATLPAADRKQYAVQSYVDFFLGLGRPVSAAFIFPAAQESCSGDGCTTGGLCCARDCPGSLGVCTNNSTCGAQAQGHRLLQAASELRARGAEVIVGSICDPNFDELLEGIAELVKPPSGLTLPSLPADDEVTLLRIADTNGATRKVCGQPLAAGTYASLADAQATGADWWFTSSANVTDPGGWNPVAVSQFVYINPLGACIANPGETYSADYLGRVPAGGCWDDAGLNSGDEMCRRILGGAAGTWTCFASDTAGACVPPTAGTPGTCICGGRADTCGP